MNIKRSWEKWTINCVILGFDALEYNAVERLKLNNLMQEEYGIVKLSKECFKEVTTRDSTHFEPWTSLVWYSFLTGNLPSNRFRHDIEIGGKWNCEILDVLKSLYMLTPSFLREKLGMKTLKGMRLLEKLGFEKNLLSSRDYCTRIFDFADKSADIEVPAFSENWYFGLEENRGESFVQFTERSLKDASESFNNNGKKLIPILKEGLEWNLLMFFTRLLDTYGELCFNRELEKQYFLVNKLVGKVKELSKKVSS